MSFLDSDAHKKTTDAVVKKTAGWLKSRYATSILAVISFAESAFAPILIDPFLIAMILANPRRWRLYVVVSIVASVLGGLFAYWLGAFFFEAVGSAILSFYGLEETFAWVATQTAKNGFVFVLIGAFTPIPYKLVALASGVLHVPILTFLVASVIGRILRLGLVGMATHVVGPRALPVVRKYLHRIAFISGIVLLVYIFIQFLF